MSTSRTEDLQAYVGACVQLWGRVTEYYNRTQIEVPGPADPTWPEPNRPVVSSSSDCSLPMPNFYLCPTGLAGEEQFESIWTHYAPPSSLETDYQELTVPTGITRVEVVPSMILPDLGPVAMDGLVIIGALLDQDGTEIEGDWTSREWSYQPG